MKRSVFYTAYIVLLVFLFTAGCATSGTGSKKITASVVRAVINAEAKKLKGAPEQVAKIENFTIPGPDSPVPVRIYTPAGSGPFPLLVYMHGGGWVAGTLDSHDNVCAFFANRVGCIVMSVDYRLAPEHKFPAAVEDSYAAVLWASKNAPRINGDVKRIAVAGNSAGANITAAVCLMAKDRGGPPLVFQLMAYPATDLAHLNTDSYSEFARGYGLSKIHVEWFRKQYLKNKEDRFSPYASPLLAADLSNLPSALVITGEFDVARDEGESYAKRLQQQGVRARYIRNMGKGHAAMLWAVASQEVRDVQNEAVTALRQAFSK